MSVNLLVYLGLLYPLIWTKSRSLIKGSDAGVATLNRIIDSQSPIPSVSRLIGS